VSQKRLMKTIRRLSLSYEERLREVELFSVEKVQEVLSSVCKYLMKATNKREPDFSHWCPVTGEEITCTK